MHVSDPDTRKIAVVGYPKSGNTWVTRLVGGLAQCPVAGFWQSDHDEIAREGLDRESNYACYKSHHALDALRNFEEQPWKVIYVLRDPRDIVFSAAPYFYNGYRKKISGQFIAAVVPDMLAYPFGGAAWMKGVMIETILRGNADVHHWCRLPWREHVQPYLAAPEILKVRYEDLILNADEACEKIVRFLETSRTRDEIRQVVEAQSFENVKRKFRRSGNRRKSGFLRKGGTGYWRSNLSPDEKELFAKNLGPILQEIGYPVD